MSAYSVTPTTKELGRALRDHLETAGRELPTSWRLWGIRIGWRLLLYPRNARGGCYSVARDVAHFHASDYHHRTMQRAASFFRAEGYVVPSCCGSSVCLGGRGHATVYLPGPRLLEVHQAVKAQRRHRFRLKGDTRVVARALPSPGRSTTEELPGGAGVLKDQSGASLTRLEGLRGAATPPSPPPATAAPPDEDIEGVGGAYAARVAALVERRPDLFSTR